MPGGRNIGGSLIIAYSECNIQKYSTSMTPASQLETLVSLYDEKATAISSSTHPSNQMTSPSKGVNSLCSESPQYNHIKAVSQEEQLYCVSTDQIIVARS
jgi:hypothetical protein